MSEWRKEGIVFRKDLSGTKLLDHLGTSDVDLLRHGRMKKGKAGEGRWEERVWRREEKKNEIDAGWEWAVVLCWSPVR
jgi:hypothetical protein